MWRNHIKRRKTQVQRPVADLFIFSTTKDLKLNPLSEQWDHSNNAAFYNDWPMISLTERVKAAQSLHVSARICQQHLTNGPEWETDSEELLECTLLRQGRREKGGERKRKTLRYAKCQNRLKPSKHKPKKMADKKKSRQIYVENTVNWDTWKKNAHSRPSRWCLQSCCWNWG